MPGRRSCRASARCQTIAAATKNASGTAMAPQPSAFVITWCHQSRTEPPLERSAMSESSPKSPSATPMMWSRTSDRMRAPAPASLRLEVVLRALALRAT